MTNDTAWSITSLGPDAAPDTCLAGARKGFGGSVGKSKCSAVQLNSSAEVCYLSEATRLPSVPGRTSTSGEGRRPDAAAAGANPFCAQLPPVVLDLLFDTDLLWTGCDASADPEAERPVVERILPTDPRSQVVALSQPRGPPIQVPSQIGAAPRQEAWNHEAFQKRDARVQKRPNQEKEERPAISKSTLLRLRSEFLGQAAPLSMAGVHCVLTERLAGPAAGAAARRVAFKTGPPPPKPAKLITASAQPRQPELMKKNELSLEGSLCSIDSICDSICSVFSSASLTEADVIIGPTHLAVRPMAFEELSLQKEPQAFQGVDKAENFPITSRRNMLSLSDIQRLRHWREVDGWRPLSFGSVLHLCNHTEHCRPCMFERKARRCRKSWLCDFCHLHTDRPLRGGRQGTKNTADEAN